MELCAKQVLITETNIIRSYGVVEVSKVFVNEMTVLASKNGLIARLCYPDLFLLENVLCVKFTSLRMCIRIPRCMKRSHFSLFHNYVSNDKAVPTAWM